MAAEVFLSCIATIGVNNGLAKDWRNIAKKMLQKDEQLTNKVTCAIIVYNVPSKLALMA